MTPSLKMPAAALAALALAAAAAAQPAKPAPRPQGAAPAPAAGGMAGVSPAGNAVLAKLANTPDPVQRDAFQKLQALAPQIAASVDAPSMDVEKFAALMHQADSLQATIKARGTERLVAALRALPPADRAPFIKNVSVQRVSPPARAPGGR